MARQFITSTVKHYCARCKRVIKPGDPYRHNAAASEFICKPCVQENEIVHAQPQPQTKRPALPA